ncbi:uncharacterized protein [Linepithema humile]|uniref:uncharacterized protein n=1 Tax=Linepithema humile TaxID=83485 RepID=UPI000623260A|nr:PREDICTED: uncharacterized protein LOC105677320 [Linepithema humile]
MSLFDILPTEILLIIFNLCDVYTLLQLNRVCKKFHEISEIVLNKKSNHLLVTNEVSKKFCERCTEQLSSYNWKFIMHYNWKYGICNKRFIRDVLIYSTEDMRFMRMEEKCLKMTENTICFYDEDILSAFNRAKDGNITGNIICGTCNCQFSSIAYCNDIIISGHEDGSIRHWRIESRNNINNIQQLKAHSNVYGEHVSNIEATTQHIISSSSNLIKIQKNTLENDNFAKENKTIYRGKKLIQSISLDPTETKVAASTEESFLIYDIKKHCKVMDKRITDNTCSQLLWQDPHTILMLYKQEVKKMDIRTREFVRTWNVSVLKSVRELHSLSSDNLYTIMTGTNVSAVLLWDQRLNDCIQTYDIHHIFNNPVHSVEFDSTHMYAVTDLNGMVEFNFKEGDYYNRAERKKYFSNYI